MLRPQNENSGDSLNDTLLNLGLSPKLKTGYRSENQF